jgi:hypothetical protein
MELRVCFSETKAKWFGWLWCPCFYSTELLCVVSTAMPCKFVSVFLTDGPHLWKWPSWFSLPASARHDRACAYLVLSCIFDTARCITPIDMLACELNIIPLNFNMWANGSSWRFNVIGGLLKLKHVGFMVSS